MKEYYFKLNNTESCILRNKETNYNNRIKSKHDSYALIKEVVDTDVFLFKMDL